MNPSTDSKTTCPPRLTSPRACGASSTAPARLLSMPVYLDDEVQAFFSERAQAKGVEVAALVNSLLRKDIELIEAATK